MKRTEEGRSDEGRERKVPCLLDERERAHLVMQPEDLYIYILCMYI